MNHLLRVCCLLFVIALPVHVAAQDDKVAATRALVTYFGAFIDAVRTGDAAAVSQHLTEPFISIDPSKTVVFATRADFEVWLRPVLGGMKERGYDHSKWPQLDLKLLSKELAVASTLVVRYKSDGTEFGRAGVTYMMRKVEDRWKIVALTVHDTAAVLKLN